MRVITFDGRIGKDAEVKTTQNGKSYLRFSVANNSFIGGEEKTDWFDVTSYDPYIIENRAKYLTKGTYVIITGTIVSDVNQYDGRLYINHRVNAMNIDTPRFGKGQGDGQKPATTQTRDEQPVSVYTANTRSDMSVQKEQPAPSAAQAPKYEYASASNAPAPDDLPF